MNSAQSGQIGVRPSTPRWQDDTNPVSPDLSRYSNCAEYFSDDRSGHSWTGTRFKSALSEVSFSLLATTRTSELPTRTWNGQQLGWHRNTNTMTGGQMGFKLLGYRTVLDDYSERVIRLHLDLKNQRWCLEHWAKIFLFASGAGVLHTPALETPQPHPPSPRRPTPTPISLLMSYTRMSQRPHPYRRQKLK